MTKLTAAAARELLGADHKVKAAERALEEAKEIRSKVRLRHRGKVGRDYVEAAGIRVRVRSNNTGRRFSLGGYLAAGKRITKEMKPFVANSTSYEVWDVEEVIK